MIDGREIFIGDGEAIWRSGGSDVRKTRVRACVVCAGRAVYAGSGTVRSGGGERGARPADVTVA